MFKKALIFLVFLGLLVPSMAGCARMAEEKKVYKVGVVIMGDAPLPTVDGLRDGLISFGYVEGENVTYKVKNVKGDYNALRSFTRELVEEEVDCICTVSAEGAKAVAEIAEDTPIVFMTLCDPVSTGVVKSRQSSGNNITGVINMALELTGKRLQLLKEMKPSIEKVYIVYNPRDKAAMLAIKQAREAAEELGLQLKEARARNIAELKEVLKLVKKEEVDAIFMICDSLSMSNNRLLIEAARRERLPLMTFMEEAVEGGALAGYGANYYESGKQSARLAKKVLEGTEPTDIPIENPEKIRFVINLKIAEEIGLDLPMEVVARADRLID